jgi:hypothetical protein
LAGTRVSRPAISAQPQIRTAWPRIPTITSRCRPEQNR